MQASFSKKNTEKHEIIITHKKGGKGKALAHM